MRCRQVACVFILCVILLILNLLFTKYLSKSLLNIKFPLTEMSNLTNQENRLLEYFVAKFGTNNTLNSIDYIEENLNFEAISENSTNQGENSTTPESTLYSCPSVPIVTVEESGSIGNQVWEYAAVWTVSRLMGRPGFVPGALKSNLSLTFSNLSLPTLEEINHCGVQVDKAVKSSQLLPLGELIGRFKGKNLLLPKRLVFLEPVFLYRDLLREELRFNPEILQQVEQTIVEAGGYGKVVVGVNVRRMDLKEFLPKAYNHTLADEAFYKRAMQWYRQNVKGPHLFLITSDNIGWCRDHLVGKKDVKIASKSPEHDLALLCASNHTIIDYGALGYWGAIMSKGHIVSLGIHSNLSHDMAKWANWTIV